MTAPANTLERRGAVSPAEGRRERVLPVQFGKKDIDYGSDGEAKTLNIRLNDHQFHLPRMDVGLPGEQWDTIFYLNISREYEPVLFEEAARWFAQQFVRDHVDIVVTPPSNKSAECLTHAVALANAQLTGESEQGQSTRSIRLVQLLGGKYAVDVNQAEKELTDFYFPITTPEGKYMGMSKSDAQYFHEMFRNSAFIDDLPSKRVKNVVIADDVLSTGKTLEAMEGIIRKATYGAVRPHVYVLARESTEPFPPLPENMTAAMYILEVAGGISPKRLSSI